MSQNIEDPPEKRQPLARLKNKDLRLLTRRSKLRANTRTSCLCSHAISRFSQISTRVSI